MNILFVLVGLVAALVTSLFAGWHQHPDDPVLASLATNRTFIGIFFAMWLYRTTRKG